MERRNEALESSVQMVLEPAGQGFGICGCMTFQSLVKSGDPPIMDAARKSAYRILLYRAMLDIRLAGGRIRWWSPLSWVRGLRDLRFVSELADALHNLAKFSWLEFEGFDEEAFWRDVEECGRKTGEFNRPALNYREVFDDRLRGGDKQF